MTETRTFRRWLRERFEAQDLGVTDLANAIGIGHATLSNYMNPTKPLQTPRREQLRKIAAYFGVDAKWLAGLLPGPLDESPQSSQSRRAHDAPGGGTKGGDDAETHTAPILVTIAHPDSALAVHGYGITVHVDDLPAAVRAEIDRIIAYDNELMGKRRADAQGSGDGPGVT